MRSRTRMLAAVTGALVAIAATATMTMTTSAEQTPDHTARASDHHMSGTHSVDEAELHDDLAQLRRATARFHDLDAAIATGYELGWVNGSGNRIITNCVANPAGAMG